MALNASPNSEKAISEFLRVPGSGGELILSIEHPCFINKGLSWIEDEKGEDSKLTISHRFDESPQLQEWQSSYAPPGTEPFVTPAFYWTLSRILKTLIRTGFDFKDVEKPRPSEEVCKKFPKMTKWRKHAGLFFCIPCEKHGLEEK